MKKLVWGLSLILVCLGSSCTQQGNKAKEKAQEETMKTTKNKDVKSSRWEVLVNNIGQHLPNEELFGIKAVKDGLEETIGKETGTLIKDWNVGSPIIKSNNIVSISGCRHNACPESYWAIYIDVATNVMNVYHFQNDKLTIYKGKELLQLPPSMREMLDTMKQNANVTEKNTTTI